MGAVAELSETVAEIQALKRERKAVILAHVYQPMEIQDLADFLGDSLGLSQEAAATDAEVIVFCGVHFMAETASILSPDKVVLLPEPFAGCPMADMVTAEELRRKKAELGEAAVVAYVNSSAAVKAESDICCTSANAVGVVRSIDPDRTVLFVPDRNLGHYVARQTERRIVTWPGFCVTHDRLSAAELARVKEAHPDAVVMVHPECRPEVIDMADKVASTAGMLRFAAESRARKFIVGTEIGLVYLLQKRHPEKEFYAASVRMVCRNMKVTRLDRVRDALRDLEPRITVPEDIRRRARVALDRMLAIGRRD